MFDLNKALEEKFKHLSNKQLIERNNSLPDFCHDDESAEIKRRGL